MHCDRPWTRRRAALEEQRRLFGEIGTIADGCIWHASTIRCGPGRPTMEENDEVLFMLRERVATWTPPLNPLDGAVLALVQATILLLEAEIVGGLG